MPLAFSNLALPAFDHLTLLPELRSLGVEGIEVAPDHTWPRPYFGQGFSVGQVGAYRLAAQSAGLKIVGLHALLGGRPELGIFEDADTRHHTIEHLVHLSQVCRDLGGRSLILDSRWARNLETREAWLQCRAFLERLLPRIEEHGTVLCFAPLAPSEGDFCRLARECLMLVNALDHCSFGLHMGTAAMAANNETGHQHFAARRGRLEHMHIDEPGLVALGASGAVDHADMRRHLSAISYDGWLSVVQRHEPETSIHETLLAAVRGFNAIYLQSFRTRRPFHV
jgi:sugar phosphate isomerase/epimerase